MGTPNANGPANVNPGDPEGIEFLDGDPVESRSLPFPLPSQWPGWPESWGTQWNSSRPDGDRKLIDIAWACIDRHSSILASMPVYHTRDGDIVTPKTWMTNPDPDIYCNWQEFARQLFWDYHLGEAFVLPFATGSDGYPMRFRVIPPYLVNVELRNGRREYKLGNTDVTGEILHIRYHSNTADARGHGPLEVAGARMTQIGLLQRYASNLAETGGVPHYWISLDRKITPSEGRDLLESWIESRTKYAGYPAIIGSGGKFEQAKTMDAKEMGLLEISQFSESRICVLLGMPPFLVGLAGASGSLTYSNIQDLFDYHDRSSLRPTARMVMDALSLWALPSGHTAELNRDDYTRPTLTDRVQAYKTLIELGILTVKEVRIMERFRGDQAPSALTGGRD